MGTGTIRGARSGTRKRQSWLKKPSWTLSSSSSRPRCPRAHPAVQLSAHSLAPTGNGPHPIAMDDLPSHRSVAATCVAFCLHQVPCNDVRDCVHATCCLASPDVSVSSKHQFSIVTLIGRRPCCGRLLLLARFLQERAVSRAGAAAGRWKWLSGSRRRGTTPCCCWWRWGTTCWRRGCETQLLTCTPALPRWSCCSWWRRRRTSAALPLERPAPVARSPSTPQPHPLLRAQPCPAQPQTQWRLQRAPQGPRPSRMELPSLTVKRGCQLRQWKRPRRRRCSSGPQLPPPPQRRLCRQVQVGPPARSSPRGAPPRILGPPGAQPTIQEVTAVDTCLRPPPPAIFTHCLGTKTCNGSGTTGHSCHMMNRSCLRARVCGL